MLNLEAFFGVFNLQIMVPYNYTEFIDTLTNHVNNKAIPMSRIDDAVRRILRVKFTMGLFENPLADQSFVGQLGSQVSHSKYYLINAAYHKYGSHFLLACRVDSRVYLI